jgi:hypothetical protein
VVRGGEGVTRAVEGSGEAGLDELELSGLICGEVARTGAAATPAPATARRGPGGVVGATSARRGGDNAAWKEK